MKSVNVKTDSLLTVLRENRTKHVNEYLSARVVYRDDVVAKLEKLLADAKLAKNPTDKLETSCGLVEPQSYVESYDTAIKMLEMSTDSTVELTNQEFQQFVEDKWSWQSSFKSVTSFYNDKA